MNRSARLNNQLQEFMELVAAEDDLNKLAQWLSKFFGHPVGIDDNNGTFLARSDLKGFEQFGSESMMEDIRNGYVSPENLQATREIQGLDLLREASMQPLKVYPPGQNFYQYWTPIPIGNTIAGVFCVFLKLDEDLDPVDRLYLKKIARLVSIVLQRTDFYTANKADFYATFFSTILDQGSVDRTQRWESRLAFYGYQLLPCLHIVAVRLPAGVRRRSELQNLATTLHHLLPNSIYCIRHDLILLLCSNRPGEFSAQYLTDTLGNCVARNDLRLGVSSDFRSIYDMASHYQEAKTAIDLGSRFDRGHRCHFYDDLQIYDMISHLAQGADPNAFAYPLYLKLLQHDQENDTQLCHTLAIYLADPKNPAAVCQKLNIHKNTLYFRLDKIRSIMGVDIHDFSVSARIFVTILILRYTEGGSWSFPDR